MVREEVKVGDLLVRDRPRDPQRKGVEGRGSFGVSWTVDHDV